MKTLQCSILLALVSQPLSAGHGFMNSFSEVEWFLEHGTLPSEMAYHLDTLQEQFKLSITSTPSEKISLALMFASEKLSEASAEIKQGLVESTKIALGNYEKYMDLAEDLVSEQDPDKRLIDAQEAIQKQFEYVYLIGVDYTDMPLGAREIFTEFFAKSLARHERMKAMLDKETIDSLFFKEEEIRWSIEMTRQADLQKITNN